MKKIVILGAGISGLAAAHFLKKEGLDTVVIEKSNRAGGLIESINKEGFLFERGPRTFRSSGKGQLTLELVSAIGLENELLVASEASKKRYLLIDGKLESLSPWLLLRLGLIPALARDLLVKRGAYRDETIASLCTRRLGRSFSEKCIDPVVLGIYGGKMDELSAEACFPVLVEWERKYGSLLRGFLKRKKTHTTLFSFQEGMESLPRALARDAEIHYNTEALALRAEGVETTAGFFPADHILSTLPAAALLKLLPTKRAILEQIPALTLTTVSLGYRKHVLTKKGFGYLVPSCMGEKILGVTFDSEVFKRGQTTLCVLMRGEGDVETALGAIHRHLEIQETPDAIDIHTARNAIPQYLPSHNARLGQLDLPHLTCIGNSFYGAGVSDCVARALEVAKSLAQR